MPPIDKTKNYRFMPKNGGSNSFKSTPPTDYKKSAYGTILTSSSPNSASIKIECLPYSTSRIADRKHIYALKNVLNSYSTISSHYEYSSSQGLWNKETQRINLINIPSIFYGSSINRGTVELSFEVSGTVIAQLNDVNKNGELIQVSGNYGSGSVAGVVLYNEGFIILTGSWPLDTVHQETYDSGSSPDYPRWIFWGSGNSSCTIVAPSSSYDLDFEGINYVNTITMFAHAEKNDLNHSNNPTYVDYSNSSNFNAVATSTTYSENEFLNIKNTTKYPYDNYTGSLEKQTFITKIGIYDENKNLIAVAKVSKPVRKTENRDFTFKLKLDI
jgi:hypothetical protein